MLIYRETTANWKREIEDDVRVECEKYGKVRHIAADPQSEGFVYLKFESVTEAQKAIDALNGRFFAKKQISAVFVAEGAYHALYPSSAAR
jgi:RNA-binding protein 39